MNYFSKVNQREIKINIDGKSVLIGETSVNCNLVPINSHGLYLLNVDGKMYEIFCSQKPDKYEISFAKYSFSVSVDDEKSRTLKKLIKVENTAPDHLEIKAPMPGLIVKVNVNEGDCVTKGQSLIIIEAMKMENEICAASDGVINQLVAIENLSVDKDAVLAVLQK